VLGVLVAWLCPKEKACLMDRNLIPFNYSISKTPQVLDKGKQLIIDMTLAL
jgi:hypothetical protein